jgi:hypothetical protein
MSQLVPCPACQRHVESNAASCPFCAAALPPARPCAGCSGPSAARVARAAVVAASAALLGAACSSSQSIFPPYGVPPHFDAGAESPPDGSAPADGSPNTNDDAK